MIKTINLSPFSKPDYVATALEGTYGLDGRDNIYMTAIKGVVFIHAVGPLSIDEALPQNALPWHLVVMSDHGVRTVRCDNSHLTFTLADGETAFGSFRMKAG